MLCLFFFKNKKVGEKQILMSYHKIEFILVFMITAEEATFQFLLTPVNLGNWFLRRHASTGIGNSLKRQATILL